MPFNSLNFLLFAITFFAAWPALKSSTRIRWVYLTLASFVFYGWWSWKYLLLLIGIGLIDFSVALAMARWPARKKALLILGISSNIFALVIFKYSNFVIENINFAYSILGTSYHLPIYDIVLPLGLSFYTFQAMSYLIDVYKNEFKPVKNVTLFFTYLALFPHILAGPIIRASDLLPQLQKRPKTSWTMLWSGTVLITEGLFKKMLIADVLAPVVGQAFSAASPESSALYWWSIMLMFTFQIYGDFSGYTDIARGLANWMGYEYPLNFNHPYCATSFKDFWGRWHISLSTWFRDYVYIPLGGNRKGRLRAHINMWITMLVSGLWHGAAWTFILWGAVHAAYLSIERETRWDQKIIKKIHLDLLNICCVFIFVLIAWVFFRSQSAHQALDIITIMFTKWPTIEPAKQLFSTQYKTIVVLIFAFSFEIIYKLKIQHWSPVYRTRIIWEPLMIAFGIILAILFRGPGNEFIYFQF